MLLGQYCGRHQNGYLLGIHDGFHHRPQGHFCFTEAYITAEQTVHGGGGFHIPFDVRDTTQLVVGFHVLEPIFKLLLPGGIRGKSKALLSFPGGIQLDQPSLCGNMGFYPVLHLIQGQYTPYKY